MIKLSANISKKVPIPGTEFSSQQFGASMEVEVSDGDQPEAIQGRIRQLYELLNVSIDEQIAAASAPQAQPAPVPVAAPAVVPVNRVNPPTENRVGAAVRQNGNGNGHGNGNGNGNGRRPMKTATVAQQRAIFAITKALGIDMAGILADYSVADVRDLTVRDASTLIDTLKQQQGTVQQ
jgi:hypothetical protein